jgi:hypothetical protein
LGGEGRRTMSSKPAWDMRPSQKKKKKKEWTRIFSLPTTFSIETTTAWDPRWTLAYVLRRRIYSHSCL